MCLGVFWLNFVGLESDFGARTADEIILVHFLALFWWCFPFLEHCEGGFIPNPLSQDDCVSKGLELLL